MKQVIASIGFVRICFIATKHFLPAPKQSWMVDDEI